MIEFERTSKHPRELMLMPLIDVVFILIVFFMLTSSFMKVESLELKIPSGAVAPSEEKAAKAKTARIFVRTNGELFFGARAVNQEELASLVKDFSSEEGEQKLVIYASANVPMQKLVDVMDIVYQQGGKSLYVREWLQHGDTPLLPMSETQPRLER